MSDEIVCEVHGAGVTSFDLRVHGSAADLVREIIKTRTRRREELGELGEKGDTPMKASDVMFSVVSIFTVPLTPASDRARALNLFTDMGTTLAADDAGDPTKMLEHIGRSVATVHESIKRTNVRDVVAHAPQGGAKDAVAWEALTDSHAEKSPTVTTALEEESGNTKTQKLAFTQTHFVSWDTVQWAAEWADKHGTIGSLTDSPPFLFARTMLTIFDAFERGAQRFAFRVSEMFGLNTAATTIDDLAVNMVVAFPANNAGKAIKKFRSLGGKIAPPARRTEGVTVVTTPSFCVDGSLLWYGYGEASSVKLPVDGRAGVTASAPPGSILVNAGAFKNYRALVDVHPPKYGDSSPTAGVHCLQCKTIHAGRVLAGAMDTHGLSPVAMLAAS